MLDEYDSINEASLCKTTTGLETTDINISNQVGQASDLMVAEAAKTHTLSINTDAFHQSNVKSENNLFQEACGEALNHVDCIVHTNLSKHTENPISRDDSVSDPIDSLQQVVLVGMNNISKTNSKSTQQFQKQRHRGDDSILSDSIYTSSDRNIKSDDDDSDSKQTRNLVLVTSEELVDDLELGTSRGSTTNVNTSFEENIIVSDDDTFDEKRDKKIYQNQQYKDVKSDDIVGSDIENKSFDDDLIEYFENSLLHGNVHSISLINSDYESVVTENQIAASKRSDSGWDQNYIENNRSYQESGSIVHMMSSLSDENQVHNHTIAENKTINGTCSHQFSIECALAKNVLHDGSTRKTSIHCCYRQEVLPIMAILSIFTVVVASFVLAQYR
jgi:hypothetical protein